MPDQPVDEFDNGAGCLTRLYWMFLGNAILCILFAYLIQNHPKFPSLLDVGCLLATASLVTVRYLDIRHFEGQTGDNNGPATMAHWRKYAAFVVAGSIVAWLIIRFAFPLFAK